jgi:hypothetical protein
MALPLKNKSESPAPAVVPDKPKPASKLSPLVDIQDLLVLDVGGTNIKIYCAGATEPIKIRPVPL